MSPEEKLKLQISRALDIGYSKYTLWEINFLKTVHGSLANKYKTVSVKQKAIAYKLTKDYKPD